MDNQKFINRCIAIVQQRIENEYSDSSGACPYFDVFVVWSCKTLQNNKAILSATLKGAPLFEITNNGDKNEMYVDTYTKKSNECIKVQRFQKLTYCPGMNDSKLYAPEPCNGFKLCK